MGQLYVDTIEPQSGTALTVGESGQNTVLAGNDLRANVLQDAGGMLFLLPMVVELYQVLIALSDQVWCC